MGSADEVNIQASELNRTMKVRPRNCVLPGQMCTEVLHPECFSMLRTETLTQILHTHIPLRLSAICRR